ncbi:unnamed protein product [Rotaria sordida]|uniref:GYF domain-containing protein n=1 Tax=Rotaria sordida TaxID=392033 RepID=A0A814D5J9_9BILA|nr:unnamed protein product [Rotaria sordida]CAF1005010.1 unnamed protein product [Rotaria sordida]CAF3727455.1 unnamed protein product [Rotaria sordida]CAF3823719.1 unnamed protein product [Rotaria sordida]
MSSTTVAQHTTQPLNFGPEWLRALSTPESTTSVPSSGGSGSGNIFKFSATKYRYSKDEILALRSNVTERLSEDVRNEIMENLKDVESVFRPNIIEPLTLTTPTAEETAKMNSLSSYISGRTPGGGGGRGGNNSQQSQQQQHDTRNNRGGGLMSNGRGGGSRGRGGRDHTFGSNRGNNNTEDSGEIGGNTGGDDTSGSSSSWSRGGYHSRGGGGFSNRVRSYDDREQSQSFRRGGGPRQTSEAWRRSRGDDEENHDQSEDLSPSTNTSTSWTSRSGQTRRGGGGGSIEHRTKSNDKWSHTDDRPGPSNSYESNQTRGWRSNTTMSDRDLNSRRPQAKRERMPEWMNDNNDSDNQLSSGTFEQDEPFSSTSSKRQNNDNNEQQQKSHTTTDDTSSNINIQSLKSSDENRHEKPASPPIDTSVINVPTTSEILESKPIPPVQHTLATWDDEFEPSDVATTVVESTLAEDHDYSPPISIHTTPHPMTIEPTPPAVVPIISQQRVQPPVIIDDKQWFYKDPQNTVQGPFSSADMERWFAAGYFTILLPVKRLGETQFSTIQQLTKELGRLPFRTDVSTLPSPVQQQPIVSETQKFNSMMYATPSTANNPYIDEYLMQQQQQPRQNLQHSSLFNRQTSMPLATADRKPVTSPTIINSQLQAYFASQQQQQHSQSSSSLFSSNLVNDPAIGYQQQPQLQRSISATNQQQQQPLFDEIHHHSFHQIPSQPNTSSSSSATTSFFGTNVSISQSQKPDDIMTRLAQAMQSHGQQQQEKVEEQRRIEQQRRELELERLKLAQQTEQLRLQREEEERRQLEQKQKFEEELRKKNETTINKQNIFDPMKEMNKTMDQKKQQQQQQHQQQPIKSQSKVEIDPFLAFQQSLQFQKEQQAKIEAQKAENVRRYQQQQLREQPQPQQSTFKLPETANWARHPSHNNDQIQTLNFAEIQKQEQEQERRAREAAIAAQHLTKTENLNIPNSPSSSSSNKSGSWARTLFAGNTNNRNNNISSDHEVNETTLPDSPITSYNQQATNAVLSLLNIHPKSRSTGNQQSAPWNATNNAPNTSLQDIQRQQQQSQNEVKQQTQQQQQQTHSNSSGQSTPAWGGVFQHSTPSSSSIFWGDNEHSSLASKSVATSNTKPSTPWTELKSSAVSSSSAAATTKTNPVNVELSKSEREAKCLFATTRTQDALSKWTQTQFKDNLQDIDVPTLVQLLKDIDSAEEIVEYVQPYIGSVIKAKEFANDFIVKRKQLANAEPELDNERLHELAMAPTSSSNTNSGNGGDEGFQLASSNGQKKKAKKMKGQKIDVKQLGFMVNNRPEQRDDIDKVPM